MISCELWRQLINTPTHVFNHIKLCVYIKFYYLIKLFNININAMSKKKTLI